MASYQVRNLLFMVKKEISSRMNENLIIADGLNPPIQKNMEILLLFPQQFFRQQKNFYRKKNITYRETSWL
jgi:hypothetical protein